jgi:hypothetical protein
MAEKSILEQALLQIENLEEAVKQNAKGILGSVVKQELNGLLKESTKEEEETTEQDMEDTDVDSDMSDVDAETDDAETDDVDADDVDTDTDTDIPDEEDDESGDEMPDVDSDDESPEMGSDDSVMDMTNASDEEVVKVFRAMKPEDGIVVKRDGNNLDVTIDGDEYVIKLDDYPSGDMNEDDMSDEMSEEDMDHEMSEEDMSDDVSEEDMTEDMEEETVYEIELDGSDDDKTPTETKEGKIEKPFKSAKGVKKVEATEAARTQGNDVRGEGPRQGKKFKAGRPELNEEVSKLRKQNDEYKKALVLFKEKLNEVAVFNASLAYATRLFTESSTTKQEKLNILKRFDSVSTMNESKQLYNTIKSELNSKKPVTESVADKITTTPKSSSSKDILAESKAYENPQFKRMKELMGKLK